MDNNEYKTNNSFSENDLTNQSGFIELKKKIKIMVNDSENRNNLFDKIQYDKNNAFLSLMKKEIELANLIQTERKQKLQYEELRNKEKQRLQKEQKNLFVSKLINSKKQKKIGYYVILRNVGKCKEYTFAISIRLDKMGSLLV